MHPVVAGVALFCTFALCVNYRAAATNDENGTAAAAAAAGPGEDS